MYLVKFHKFFGVHFLILIERDEFDVLWLRCFVSEWSFDFGHVVRSNSDKGSVSSKIGMKFILKGKEGLISPFIEFDSSKNGSSCIRSNVRSLNVNNIYQDSTSGMIVRVSSFSGTDNLY